MPDMQPLKTRGSHISVLLAFGLCMLKLHNSWITHPSCKASTDNIFCLSLDSITGHSILAQSSCDVTRKLVPLAPLKRPMQKTKKEYRKLLLTWLTLKRLAVLLTVLSTTSAKHRNALWLPMGRRHAANSSLAARATLLHWQQKIELVRSNVTGGRLVQSPQSPIKRFPSALSPMASWKQKAIHMHVYFSHLFIYLFFLHARHMRQGTYVYSNLNLI